MKKKLSLGLFLVVVVIVIVNLYNRNSHDDYRKVILDYKEQFYFMIAENSKGVKGAEEYNYFSEEMKGYLTDAGFNSLLSKRIVNIYSEVAKKGALGIKVKDVKITKIYEENNDNSVSADYEVSLAIKYQKSQEVEVVENGQVTLVKVDQAQWKIEHDYWLVNKYFKEAAGIESSALRF